MPHRLLHIAVCAFFLFCEQLHQLSQGRDGRVLDWMLACFVSMLECQISIVKGNPALLLPFGHYFASAETLLVPV